MRSMPLIAVISIAITTAGCDPFARQSVCESCRDRDAALPTYSAVFVEPASAAGKDTIETEKLQIRVMPLQYVGAGFPSGQMLAKIEVRNKRDKLARLDATQSCLIDAEAGAFNLELVDRIIPAGSFVQLLGVSASYMTVNVNMFIMGMTNQPARLKITEQRRQRIMLRIKWVDGKREMIDATYVVKPAPPSPDHPE